MPCDKDSLRHCLIFAIAMSDDEETRARLRNGYVMLEAFVTAREYEAVRRFEDTARRLRRHREGVSAEAMHELICAASVANERANEIETRVVDRMHARRRELAGAC